MILCSYIIARDYGFAPNPFGGYCTLACCKSPIRGGAQVGDWVIGTGSVQHKLQGKLIYAMEVSEKMGFNDYWNDYRFYQKRPNMDGSSKTLCGDNIYHRDDNNLWIQEDSHHSKEDGSTNTKNLASDTAKDAVLISNNFYYFGRNAVDIPQPMRLDLCHTTQGQKKIDDLVTIDGFLNWLKNNYSPGYNADPFLFQDFKRFP